MMTDSELGVPPGASTVNMTLPYGRGTSRINTNLFADDIKAPFIELRGSILDVGIFRDTLLPSFGLHTGLSLIAYAAGRATNRLEAKDWLWPSAQLISAWWSAVGNKVVNKNVPLHLALSSISRPERLILTGVSLWSARHFYRIATRSLARGKDDERYDAMKNEEGFWDGALFKIFLPEALFQTIIALPFTAPFRHQGGVFTGYHPVMQSVSVGLFCTGFALELLADAQLDKYKREKADLQLLKQGVWSIVRHPNYLGDALIHFSFPLMLYSSDMLAPIELFGPLANYLFLRYVGGDKQTEEHQEEKYVGTKKADFEAYRNTPTINSFWPHWEQVENKWTWTVLGAGAVGAVAEQILHQFRLDG